VGPLGFGSTAIGGLYEPVSPADALAATRAALAVGMTHLDTAPHYGLGMAEERLGLALAGVPRDSFVLSTKVGRLLRPLRPEERIDPQGYAGNLPRRRRVWDFSAAGVEASLLESLDRLGLDRVDVVYLHDPDEHERAVFETGYQALASLRARGVVGAIGAGMNQAPMLSRFVRDLDLDVVLLAGRYTLLDQSGLAELLPLCLRRGTSVVIGGVFNSGVLADPRPGARYDYGLASGAVLARARALRDVCSAHGVPLAAAAIQFPFGHPAVASVLVGARSAAQVREDADLFQWPIPDALWADLVSAGLLTEQVPTPGLEPAGLRAVPRG
jgi:D-threo-aldose 1-dehydrogenase